jgi:hypothetical protein
MINKAQQYAILKAALEAGSLESIKDITTIMPITFLCEDMDRNYNTLSKRLLAPGRFTVKDVLQLATLIGIKADALFDMIGQEIKQSR